MSHIGTLREGPLHAALKHWYAEPGDRLEQPVEGSVVDIVRGDLLIEIQTGGFTPLRRKLDRLLAEHTVRIVHPVAVDTWIVRVGEGGEILSRRRSPKHGSPADVFAGLVSIVDHLASTNLQLDVVEVVQEQIRRHEPGKAWRRNGWVVDHRRLVEVRGVTEIRTTADLDRLIPQGLAEPFTTADLAAVLGAGRRLGQQMTYCLRSLGRLVQVDGHPPRYVRTE